MDFIASNPVLMLIGTIALALVLLSVSAIGHKRSAWPDSRLTAIRLEADA